MLMRFTEESRSYMLLQFAFGLKHVPKDKLTDQIIHEEHSFAVSHMI
jgi:hypothetical protein